MLSEIMIIYTLYRSEPHNNTNFDIRQLTVDIWSAWSGFEDSSSLLSRDKLKFLFSNGEEKL